MNVSKLVEGSARSGFRLARWGASFAQGQVQRVVRGRSGPKPDMDDATLKAKVETELFRPADAPKGDVDVSVFNGVVQLRGTAKNPEQVRGLEERVRKIPEVRGVENLLHLPKTPSPTRTDSAATERKRAARSGGANQRAATG